MVFLLFILFFEPQMQKHLF